MRKRQKPTKEIEKRAGGDDREASKVQTFRREIEASACKRLEKALAEVGAWGG